MPRKKRFYRFAELGCVVIFRDILA